MSTTTLFSRGDFVIDESTERPVMISGAEKGLQDVLFAFTAQEPYGAGINARFGQVPRSGAAFSAELTEEARSAFERLQAAQQQYQAEAYTPDEKVVTIDSVYAEQAPERPTDYRFFVRVSLGETVVEVEV